MKPIAQAKQRERAGRGFGVILDAEQGGVRMRKSLDGIVVEIDVRNCRTRSWKGFGVHRSAV